MKARIFLILIMVLFFGCQQDEIYDGKINEDFAKTIVQLPREKWMYLDNEEREQLYLTFSSKQKYDFWKQKIEEVLSLDWNAGEIEHINKLNNFIDNNKYIFDLRLSEQDNELTDDFRVFMYKWKKYAYNELGWSKKLIISLIQSGYDLLDRDGTLSVNSSIALSRSIQITDRVFRFCDCNGEYEPWGDYHYCAVWVACAKKNFCGDFFLYECDGRWMSRG